MTAISSISLAGGGPDTAERARPGLRSVLCWCRKSASWALCDVPHATLPWNTGAAETIGRTAVESTAIPSTANGLAARNIETSLDSRTKPPTMRRMTLRERYDSIRSERSQLPPIVS